MSSKDPQSLHIWYTYVCLHLCTYCTLDKNIFWLLMKWNKIDESIYVDKYCARLVINRVVKMLRNN